MDWQSLHVAAFYDNDSFIKDYLDHYQASEENKTTLTKILHKAVESCSVKVVKAVVNSPHGMYPISLPATLVQSCNDHLFVFLILSLIKSLCF